MDLLKNSIISEHGNKFINSDIEEDDPFIGMNRNTNMYEGNKFLDSSLNNRLQPLQNINEKKQDYVQLRNQSLKIEQLKAIEKKNTELFDFPHISDKSIYNNSGIDYVQFSMVGEILQNHIMEIQHKQIQEIGEKALKVSKKELSKIIQPSILKKQNWLQEKQQCISQQAQEPMKIIKNETKNIPKNYGKAIISFIQKNKAKVIQVISPKEISYIQLLNEFKMKKKTINTIADLRNLWTNSKYSIEMRKLSNLFLRKYALQYIFNSRITNYASHIKYRHKLREALTYPDNFKNIKDY